jgi:hypothetical protein
MPAAGPASASTSTTFLSLNLASGIEKLENLLKSKFCQQTDVHISVELFATGSAGSRTRNEVSAPLTAANLLVTIR